MEQGSGRGAVKSSTQARVRLAQRNGPRHTDPSVSARRRAADISGSGREPAAARGWLMRAYRSLAESDEGRQSQQHNPVLSAKESHCPPPALASPEQLASETGISNANRCEQTACQRPPARAFLPREPHMHCVSRELRMDDRVSRLALSWEECLRESTSGHAHVDRTQHAAAAKPGCDGRVREPRDRVTAACFGGVWTYNASFTRREGIP